MRSFPSSVKRPIAFVLIIIIVFIVSLDRQCRMTYYFFSVSLLLLCHPKRSWGDIHVLLLHILYDSFFYYYYSTLFDLVLGIQWTKFDITITKNVKHQE